MKSLQIFKPGKHTATDGRTIEFSESDLQAACAAYDPALHEAPLVVGHPKNDAPAYGWVKSLAFEECIALAVPHQVDVQFAELVNAGRFKKISASFYTPDAPNNPKPGVYYLRHVGFLGAQPPAVKGLKSAAFADGDEGVVEFSDYCGTMTARMFRRLRDWIISTSGLETADKVLADWEIQSLESAAAGDMANPAYNEHTTEDDAMKTKEQQLAEREAALQAQKEAQDRKDAQFAEREQRLQADETARRNAAIAARVEAVIASGRLLPKDKEAAIAFACAQERDAVVEFGEGDKKQTPKRDEWFLAFLEGLPTAVDLSERGAARGAVDTTDPLELSQRALEFQESERKAGREISVTAAVMHVQRAGA